MIHREQCEQSIVLNKWKRKNATGSVHKAHFLYQPCDLGKHTDRLILSCYDIPDVGYF